MKLSVDADGYETIRGPEDRKRLYHHRVLSYARGELDSVFFSEDMREVHHRDRDGWQNAPSNLRVLSPEEHRETDAKRARLVTPWDRRGGRA